MCMRISGLVTCGSGCCLGSLLAQLKWVGRKTRCRCLVGIAKRAVKYAQCAFLGSMERQATDDMGTGSDRDGSSHCVGQTAATKTPPKHMYKTVVGG